MGAEFFQSVTRGHTAIDAFNKAVKQAQYDHGHSGYSGTIAEKSTFEMAADTPLTRAEAKLIIESCDEGTGEFQDKWGPAACIEIDAAKVDGERLFVFFGLASS